MIAPPAVDERRASRLGAASLPVPIARTAQSVQTATTAPAEAPAVARLLGLVPTLVLVAAIVATWEIAVRVSQVPAYLFPSASAVGARWIGAPGFFLGEGAIALAEALGGLLLGGGVAFVVSLTLARSPWLERAVLPLAIVVKMTPVVVVAPLFVLWFGFGPLPRVLIAALLTFFPVVIGATTGLRQVDPARLDVLRALDASPWEELRLLRLPSALPHLFAALKVSATLALLGAVIAEWVGGDRGLGRAILLANSNLDITTALAGVLTLGAIGSALVGGLTWIERRVVFWQQSLDRL